MSTGVFDVVDSSPGDTVAVAASAIPPLGPAAAAAMMTRRAAAAAVTALIRRAGPGGRRVRVRPRQLMACPTRGWRRLGSAATGGRVRRG